VRVWSLHPKYLDPTGLVALWRETLLARAVLKGETRGYRHHPQLDRFREQRDPVAAVEAYLRGVHQEASERGYAFDEGKLGSRVPVPTMPVTTGQIACEWTHLLGKLAVRAPVLHAKWRGVEDPDCHPLFRKVPGPVAPWEKAPSV
jgi:hypothetical protein